MTRSEAKAAGLLRYFTGKACPHGHISERLVANWTCIACVDEKQQKRRADGLMKEKDKERYWRDPAANNAKSQSQYQKHREKRVAYEKDRNAKPERHASLLRRAREYAKRHPGRINSLTAQRRASLKSAMPPWLTPEMLREIRAIYEDARKNGLEVDHIIPAPRLERLWSPCTVEFATIAPSGQSSKRKSLCRSRPIDHLLCVNKKPPRSKMVMMRKRRFIDV